MAVLSVMVAHAGLPLRAGYLGVDVFFVISGFLITGLLLRELRESGSISWPRFLARRVRRLLPAAVLVLLVTAVVTFLVVPGLRRRDIGWDIAAAGTYVVNWLFADRSVDYLASDVRPSPVQHYWSLSVEEQFYLVWPLLLAALALLARRSPLMRRAGRPRGGVVIALLAVITLASFADAVWRVRVDPAPAYFVTTARAWELGIGALLAAWLAYRPDWATAGPDQGGPGHPRTRAAIGWLGLLAILAGAALIPHGAGWPSWWTLVPTLGAVAVLWSGSDGGDRDMRGPVCVLGAAPMVWIGALSYSLYLWHWPVVVLADWMRERPMSTMGRVVVTVASVLPAYLGHRFIERPLHHGPFLATGTRRALAVGAALSGAAVLAGLPLAGATSGFVSIPPAGVDPATLGASTIGHGPDPATVERWPWIVPDPMSAGGDRPAADTDRCQLDRRDAVPVRCDFGKPDGAVTVALVGDSKALQWLPAFQRLADRHGWRIITYGKSLCPLSAAPAALGGRAYPSCDEFNARVHRALLATPPDLVVTSTAARQGWDGARATRAALRSGLAAAWEALRAAGIPVLVIGDNPVSPDDLDICAARHPRQLSRCAFDRRTAIDGSALGLLSDAARESETPLLDLSDWLCPGPRCPVVIGNVTVNRAGDHVTATYAASLAPQILPAVAPLLAGPDLGPGSSGK